MPIFDDPEITSHKQAYLVTKNSTTVLLDDWFIRLTRINVGLLNQTQGLHVSLKNWLLLHSIIQTCC